MRWKLKTAALLLACAIAGAAGAAGSQAPEKGKLLVATPEMRDPRFAETVVLLLHHDGNGTIGVAINRPTWVEPQTVVPEVGEIEGFDGSVYLGGPLAPTQLIFLVRDPPAGTFEAPAIFDRIYASGNLELLEGLVGAPLNRSRLRLYAGHLEWAAGQVEREIENGGWLVVDGTPDRVFAPDPDKLWHRMSTGGDELLVERSEQPGLDAPAAAASARRGGE